MPDFKSRKSRGNEPGQMNDLQSHLTFLTRYWCDIFGPAQFKRSKTHESFKTKHELNLERTAIVNNLTRNRAYREFSKATNIKLNTYILFEKKKLVLLHQIAVNQFNRQEGQCREQRKV